jgi:hypothetical protein
MDSNHPEGTVVPDRAPPEGDPRHGSLSFDPSDPPVDYQPECGQPGPRLPPDDAERDEDDDL